MLKTHSFHIPVMGIGFTVDTPLKVSPLGVDSVIFISDDLLLENLRKKYSKEFNVAYEEISNKDEDYRAKRVTSYLNLINSLVDKKMVDVEKSILDNDSRMNDYISMFPHDSPIRKAFDGLDGLGRNELENWIKNNLSKGSIDVNIMTKLDKDNYKKGEKRPIEYNDAHAALRGFAKSNLESSVIFSAGMNPRLYSYLEQFDDFYPDRNGKIKKKIVLKVSDYRSAFIQGKFLAKKGIWVSEYRIESGLNCGGHAFATDGFLLGPILAEFRDNRNELILSVTEILFKALADKKRLLPKSNALELKITAQGGVGTFQEHQFLLNHYKVDSVGWGTPFLLVPEVTNVDQTTLKKLVNAKESDLYLSDISPLGIPFNNLKDSTKGLEKLALVKKGKPGSPCISKYLSFNTEYTDKPICTASRQYQNYKIDELKGQDISVDEFQKRFDKIVDKECICTGLSTPALLVNHVETVAFKKAPGVSICPGPNLAYFSKIVSLKEMINHIYGRANVITRDNRPHMFIKELNIYIDYLKNKIDAARTLLDKKQEKYLKDFTHNLKGGIEYYHCLIQDLGGKFDKNSAHVLHQLDECENTLNLISLELGNSVSK